MPVHTELGWWPRLELASETERLASHCRVLHALTLDRHRVRPGLSSSARNRLLTGGDAMMALSTAPERANAADEV